MPLGIMNFGKVLEWENLGAEVYWLGNGIGMATLGIVGLVYI